MAPRSASIPIEAELALLLSGTQARREAAHGRITELAAAVDEGALLRYSDRQRMLLLIVHRLEERSYRTLSSSAQTELACLRDSRRQRGAMFRLAILGLCAGTPVLPISYEFKTTALFARLGMAEYTSDVDGIDGDDLIGRFDRFWAHRADWTPSLCAGVERERKRADEAVEVLRSAGWR